MAKVKKVTQKQRILKHLESGRTITPMGSINQYGAYRLSSIIEKLRNEGYHIETERAVIKNKRGQRMNLSRYRMVA